MKESTFSPDGMMACSIVTAERLSVEGLTDSPDSQQCRLIFAQYTIPSDPIDCPEDANHQHNVTAAHFTPSQQQETGVSQLSGHSRHSYERASSQQCSLHILFVPDAPLNRQARTTKSTAVAHNHDVPARNDILEIYESHRGVDDNTVQFKSLKTTKPHINPHPAIALLSRPADSYGGPLKRGAHTSTGHNHHRTVKMENLESPSNGSNASTLSTTQEIDEALYLKYVPDGTMRVSAKVAGSDSPPHESHEVFWEQHSAKSTLQTHPSYRTGDEGHIEIMLDPSEPSDPIRDPVEPDDEIIDGTHQQHHNNPFRSEVPDPKTPAQGRPFFAKNSNDNIPLAELFGLTQPPNTGGYLNAFPPSSARPSPDMLNANRRLQSASSPLVRRIVEPTLPEKAFLSSSPPRFSDGQKPENVSETCTSSVKAPEASVESSSFIRRNTPEPLQVYTSRKASQERRARQRDFLSQGGDSSDEEDLFDDEFEPVRRARRVKAAAAKEIAAAEARRPSTLENDLVEVPSTARGRRRSVEEDYIAQCLGTDARDTQEEETLIMDSQSRAPVAEEELALAHEHGDLMNVPQYDEVSVEGDVPDSGSVSDHEVFCRRAPNKPLREMSPNRHNIQTPVTHKETISSGDAMVPETSPTRSPFISHHTTFAEITGNSPTSSSTNNIDFANIPGFTPDEDVNVLLGSSQPVHSPSRRRLRTTRAPASSGQELISTLRSTTSNHSSVDLPVLRNDQPAGANSTAVPPRPMDSVPAETQLNDTTPVQEGLSKLAVPKDRRDILSKDMVRSFTTANNKLRGPTTEGQFVETSIQEPARRSRDDAELGIETAQSSPLSSLSSLTSLIPDDLESAGPSANSEEIATGIELRSPSERAGLRSTPNPRNSRSIASEQEALDRSGPPRSHISDVTKPKPGNSSLRRKKTQDAIIVEAYSEVVLVSENNDKPPSSRALRALAKTHDGNPSNANLSVSGSITKPGTRSSKRTSTSISDRTGSVEPIEKTTPSRFKRLLTPTHAAEQSLFYNMAFSVSYSKQDANKERVLKLIQQNGGRILDTGFNELFVDISSLSSPNTKESEVPPVASEDILELSAKSKTLGFTCLIADEHSRKVKYMQALALGLPCLSGRWVEDCVQKNVILDWEPYLLAAGNSSFLNGAVRNRNLRPYSAATAKFSDCYQNREKLLAGKSIILVMGKGKEKDRKGAYLFLTRALGARRVLEVDSLEEASKVLLATKTTEEQWDWVYHDEKKEDGQGRKRKKSAMGDEGRVTKRLKTIGDEYVIQSLILGKLMEGE